MILYLDQPTSTARRHGGIRNGGSADCPRRWPGPDCRGKADWPLLVGQSVPVRYPTDTFEQRPGRCEEQVLPEFIGLLPRGVIMVNDGAGVSAPGCGG